MGDNQQGTEVVNKDWALARLLFEKFGMLHSFHEEQLTNYVVGCCNISLGGKVGLNGDTRTVTFDILTERQYRKTQTQLKRRGKLSGLIAVGPSRYKREKALAYENLIAWTRRLLWSNTNITLSIDGVRYAG